MSRGMVESKDAFACPVCSLHMLVQLVVMNLHMLRDY